MPTFRQLAQIMLLASTISLAPGLQAAGPLPDDLQLVPADSLPAMASWYSVTRWAKYPPSPVNWCAGRDDVLYYRSASFGTNKIIIDDTTVEYPLAVASEYAMSLPSGALGPSYGPDDIWLEIRFDTNIANNIDLILHNATNGFWQIESKTNLADPNLAWTFVDADVVDQKSDIFFGPFQDLNPALNFYRAKRIDQPFEIVATNVPSPVGIDYSPAQQALILSVNYFDNLPNNFAILDTNSVLTAWSGIGGADDSNETRLFTVKFNQNGLTAGDLLFGSSPFSPATIGWLSADGTTSNLTWAVLTNEQNIVEALYMDDTGAWSNDVLAVAGEDIGFLTPMDLNVWRISSQTNASLVCTIQAHHLDGLVTLPDTEAYGPWAGKLLTADEQQHTIYAIGTDGVVTTNLVTISPDCFRMVPQSEDLYCVHFLEAESRVLKLPRRLLKHHVGEVLILQAGEVLPDSPAIFFAKWNGASLQTVSVHLFDYFPAVGVFEKVVFAPIDLPMVH